MIASASVQTAADSTRARLCVLCAAGFLCPLTENVYDVEFLAFKIRDAETGKVRAPRGPPATLSSRHRGNGSNGDVPAAGLFRGGEAAAGRPRHRLLAAG